METTRLRPRHWGLCLVFIWFFSAGLAAQDSTGVKGRLEVEVEPAAFIFRGYSLNFGYQTGPFRISVKSFAVNQPILFVGNTYFAVQSSGIGFEVDYLFRPRSTPFLGLLSDYHSDQVFTASSTGSGLRRSVSAGLRAGYRYFPAQPGSRYRGIYLSGSVAAFSKLGNTEVEVAGHRYGRRALYLIPAVNVGYHF